MTKNMVFDKPIQAFDNLPRRKCSLGTIDVKFYIVFIRGKYCYMYYF